jgi:hypothetical protein
LPNATAHCAGSGASDSRLTPRRQSHAEYRRAFLADAFAIRAKAQENNFSLRSLTPCSLRCARRQALALRATPNGAARKILLLPPKKPVDLLHPLAAIAANNKQEEIVMGLDSYAYIIENSFVISDVDFHVDQNYLNQLYYWRKHHDLHGWMERLYIAKGGQNPQFNLSGLSLNSADLDALEKAVNAGDPPETLGFCFSHSHKSQLDDDREFIRKARGALKDGLAVIYVAFW